MTLGMGLRVPESRDVRAVRLQEVSAFLRIDAEDAGQDFRREPVAVEASVRRGTSR